MKKTFTLMLCLCLLLATFSGCIPEESTENADTSFGTNATILTPKTDNTNVATTSDKESSKETSSSKTENTSETKQPSTTSDKTSSTTSSNSSETSEQIKDVVYIYPTGTKYHSNSSCSRKNNAPTEISIEKAESQGYSPCKKCH
ncbi:MAG: hypothetical protein J6C26_02220 [Clostridia bacterium]|nr:hypothetical protein [Clostridia bacterium]